MPFWLLPRSAKSREQLGKFISLSRPSLPKSGDWRLTLDLPLFIRSVHGVTLTPRGTHLRERLQRVFVDLE
jgi:hypothetical protein